MILFRKVRDARDAYGWVAAGGLLLLFCVGVFLATAAFSSDDWSEKLFTCLYLLVTGTVAVILTFSMLFSRHHEFVVEDGFLHWGQVGRAERHRRLAIDEVQVVEHHTSEGWLYAVTRHHGRVRLPENILMFPKDQSEFCEFLQQSFPQISVRIDAR